MWYTFRFFFYILLMVCLVILVSQWSTRNQRKYSKTVQKQVKGLVDQAAQLAVQSKQDQNEFIAVVHVTEADSLLKAVLTLVHPEDLGKLANIDYVQITEQIEKQKQETTQRLFTKYPTLIPQHSLATIAGWYPPVE